MFVLKGIFSLGLLLWVPLVSAQISFAPLVLSPVQKIAKCFSAFMHRDTPQNTPQPLAGDTIVVKDNYIFSLHVAAMKGQMGSLAWHIKNGTPLNTISSGDKTTALIQAVEWSRLPAVTALLDAGADPNIRTLWDSGWVALHYAIQMRDIDVLKKLLEHGADPNIQEYQRGWSPLHYLVWYSNDLPELDGEHVSIGINKPLIGKKTAAFRLLLEAGADPTLKDNKGQTAIDLAKKYENNYIITHKAMWDKDTRDIERGFIF